MRPEAILFFLIFLIFILGRVTQVTDSNYSMMVSESILKYGTFRLDHYNIPHKAPFSGPGIVASGYPYQLEVSDGHLYYTFPPGTSILSVPFVGMLNILGVSAVNPDGSYSYKGEVRIERVTSAILMAFLSVVFYWTARLLLGVKESVVLSLIGVLATPIFSTASRGMWSHTWLVLLLGITLFIIMRSLHYKYSPNPILLATLLSWMYFVRPTASIGIIAISILVFIYWRNIFIRFAVVGMIWFGGFVIYSLYNFGTILPSYYSAGRLGSTTFFEALAGNMISPARGLIVYSPFLLVVIYLFLRNRNRILYKPLATTALIAVAAHWVAVSGFPHWWAGYSYGPRFMTDVTPWLVIICILLAATLAGESGDTEGVGSAYTAIAKRKWLLWSSAVLVVISICIQGRGAYSQDTFSWNVYPNSIDKNPDRLWDWSYPQFLAGLISPGLDAVDVPVYILGTRIWLNSKTSQPFLISGWSGPEPDFRWTDGEQAVLGFRLKDVHALEMSMKLAPFVVNHTHEWQRLRIEFNGKFVAEIKMWKQPMGELKITIPSSIVRLHNIVKFKLPDAESPKKLHVSDDPRTLGIAVKWIDINTI